MADWQVLVPDYYESWWKEYDTYGSEKLAREQYDRHDRAKLVRIERNEVAQKGKLKSNEENHG